MTSQSEFEAMRRALEPRRTIIRRIIRWIDLSYIGLKWRWIMAVYFDRPRTP